MSVEKNQTAIQALKILYSQNKKKPKKTHYKKIYPRNIEAKYKTKLSNFYRPLVDFVYEFFENNQEKMLRGDSVEIKCDILPGGAFRKLVQVLEGWLSIYMPTIPEMKEGQNNVIFMGLNQTANQLKEHEDKQFQKQLQNGIGVSFQTNAPWWPNTKANWTQNNYSLIVSNARNYVNQINTLAEQAVVNGWSVKQLQEQIKKASVGLTDKKCRLLARDQIGKLQGQVSQAQMEEVGLEMYVWETSGDERVRSTHIPMDGLLCRWDDSTVYSVDGGKHWIPRPSNAVKLHPGQDIQCRCIAVAYMPELLYEVSGEKIDNDIDDGVIVEISPEAKAKMILSEQNQKLNKPQERAIKHYTEAFYDTVNNYLRGLKIHFGTKTAGQKIIKQLDEVMSNIKPLSFDLKLFRTEWSNNNYDPFYHKGEKIKFDAFTSTSISKKGAKPGNIFYEITIPKGKSGGFYIGEKSGHPNEMEFLLNRGLEFEVTDVEVIGKNNRKYKIKML